MFDVILAPVINAVRAWTSARVREAARLGTQEGLALFAAEVAEAARVGPANGIAAPAPERPLAIPMPAAAQVTEEGDEPCPALDVPLFERLRELIDGGMTQTAAARELGIPESTARRWLKRASA